MSQRGIWRQLRFRRRQRRSLATLGATCGSGAVRSVFADGAVCGAVGNRGRASVLPLYRDGGKNQTWSIRKIVHEPVAFCEKYREWRRASCQSKRIASHGCLMLPMKKFAPASVYKWTKRLPRVKSRFLHSAMQEFGQGHRNSVLCLRSTLSRMSSNAS